LKSDVIAINKKKWEPIKEPVKEWVQENWWTWKEEKPGWFTDAWIAKVPDDFIPAEEDRVALQKLRRKNSVLGTGSVKLLVQVVKSSGSSKMASVVPTAGAIAGAEGAGTQEDV
jgi:hypothetical protein